MKRILYLIASLILSLAAAVAPLAFAEETADISDTENWIIPSGYEGRVSIEKKDEGIVISQLVQGTPSNHAVAVTPAIEVPIDGSNHSFEVVFSIEMEEFVASGRNANDVWTGIGLMGKPVFINWRNNATDGYAKDSPGLFTRFFNYSGELRIITDVYHENYFNGIDYVDTWTLLQTAAGASISNDITLKLSYEKDGDDTFYNLYINGKKLTGGAEFLNVKPEGIFPDGKLYLMIAMNTQEKETNQNSKVIIKKINNTSFVVERKDDGKRIRKGCKSEIGFIGVGALVAVAFCVITLAKERR